VGDVLVDKREGGFLEPLPELDSRLRAVVYRQMELPESSSDEATRKNLREFYKTTMAIPADSIACAIAYAIEQPSKVEIDEIVIRPTAQDF
jgi:NADP-dependent 3-hydroxy acid dehydrogenase YdfG